jgi:hypothetical protein
VTALLTGFPDVEAAVLDLLDSVASTVTSTPANFTPPLVQVQRIGGEDDGLTDYPVVVVTCYGASRSDAWEMAEDCRQLILASVNEEPGGALVDSAATITPAQQIPDPNTALRVVTATYRLGLRRPRTS